MAKRRYLYKGYTITNCGYHHPDHCVWWEAVDKDGYACFHGHTLREVEMLINDSEWEDKLRAKDALIKELTDALKKKTCKVNCKHFFCSSKFCRECVELHCRELIAKARKVVGDNRAKDGAVQDGEVGR